MTEVLSDWLLIGAVAWWLWWFFWAIDRWIAAKLGGCGTNGEDVPRNPAQDDPPHPPVDPLKDYRRWREAVER